MKNIFAILILFICKFAMGQVYPESQIEELIRSKYPFCKSCQLVMRKSTIPMIQNQWIFEVTTLDIMPHPLWNVVVTPNKKALLLSFNETKQWNEMIQNETLVLKSNEDIVMFAKTFVRLTSPQSLFLDSIDSPELKKIEKLEKKSVDRKPKITKTSDKIQVVFYAFFPQGAFQQWNLVFTPKGLVTKVTTKTL